jgi:hypothetical protein
MTSPLVCYFVVYLPAYTIYRIHLERRVPTKSENNKHRLGREGLPTTFVVVFAPSDTATVSSPPHIHNSQELDYDKWNVHHQKANDIRQHVRFLRLARRKAAVNAAA